MFGWMIWLSGQNNCLQLITNSALIVTFIMPPGTGGYRQINKALNICAFEDYLEGQQTTLPKLQDVEQISPRVIRVLGQNPGKARLKGPSTGESSLRDH
jgi:hypothetical protein